MRTISPFLIVSAVMSVSLGTSAAFAQDGKPEANQPKQHKASPAPAKAGQVVGRVGDPYSLDTCPVTGKKLGSMGDAVVMQYDGREVRFCCPACPPKFEKDLAANLAKIDQQITKDQGPLYPLTISVVTGKDLPAKPCEFVYGNRLIRVGTENEKADFIKDPKRYLGELDKAVIAAQEKDYPLKACPVSKEALGGDMGKPVDLVVGGRLVRLCCKDCRKEIEKEPAKFVAMVDAARKAERKDKSGGDEKGNEDHKGHDHGK